MARDKQKDLEDLKKAMQEHKRKLETDPEYRKRSEERRKRLDKYLPGFGNDAR